MEIPFTDSVSNLIASFNFRRAVALVSILIILGSAAWTVDFYSDFSRLSRLERATALIERMHALDEKKLGDDLVTVRKRIAAELSAVVAMPVEASQESRSNETAFRDWFARVWKKFASGALPWFLSSLLLLPAAFRKEKNAWAGFFGFQVATIFFGVVVATIPPIGTWIVDYLVLPWGLFVFIAVIPMSVAAATAYRKVRDSSLERAILNNLRQITAAADQYFLEHGASEVAVCDLVGPEPHKYIKSLMSVDGERYEDLWVRQGEPVTVVRRNGDRVTYGGV
ncbi:MAG: hypothetical protein NDI75_07860 [Candidatus Didemnitutus sp.]|nr:hypothetical protein [Candidatus Didemnitutus sp.]